MTHPNQEYFHNKKRVEFANRNGTYNFPDINNLIPVSFTQAIKLYNRKQCCFMRQPYNAPVITDLWYSYDYIHTMRHIGTYLYVYPDSLNYLTGIEKVFYACSNGSCR
jgi:hypothetical protein